jgi:hypothetical protein
MQTWKPKLTWQRLIAIASLALIFFKTITSRFFPELVISEQISAMSMIILLTQLSCELPSIINRYSKNRSKGMTITQQLIALVPDKLISLFHLECGQQRAFLCWVRQKKLTMNEVDGEIFSYHQKSQYSTFLTILFILCLTDIPISTLMLGLAIDDSLTRMYLHIFLFVTTLYTIMWLIADRHAVRSTHHIAGTNSLYLRVGERFDAVIPWIACDNALPVSQNKELKDSRSAWLHKQGFSAAATVFCTPFDQPNVALIINQTDSTNIEKYKIKKTKIKCILVYVDEPSKFIHSVHRHVQSFRSEYLPSQLPTEGIH